MNHFDLYHLFPESRLESAEAWLAFDRRERLGHLPSYDSDNASRHGEDSPAPKNREGEVNPKGMEKDRKKRRWFWSLI
jgi:hypothetical protein